MCGNFPHTNRTPRTGYKCYWLGTLSPMLLKVPNFRLISENAESCFDFRVIWMQTSVENSTSAFRQAWIFTAFLVSCCVVLFGEPTHACSFGPLDRIKVGDSMDSILSDLSGGCGGSINIRRYESSFDQPLPYGTPSGKAFVLCAEGGRYSEGNRLILIGNKVVYKVKGSGKRCDWSLVD